MAWIWSDELAQFAVTQMGRTSLSAAALSGQLVCYNLESQGERGAKVRELLGEDEEEPPLISAA